jgi:hypothetical protein
LRIQSKGAGPRAAPITAILGAGAVPTSRADRQSHKSMRMTTRRGDGRETSVKPAAANVPSVPTCSSSETAFLVVMGYLRPLHPETPAQSARDAAF